MDILTRKLLKKPQLLHSKLLLKKKLDLTISLKNRISLQSKTQNKNFGFSSKGLSIENEQVFNVSNENILETPSTINDNQPLSLNLLDQSLTKYYETEVNRIVLGKNANTPVPCLPSSRINKNYARSISPTIRQRKKPCNNTLPIVGTKVKDKPKGGKRNSESSGEKNQQKNVRIRYFSRRERKNKSPELGKYEYYCFN